jgi:hypothetical protein
MKLLRRNITKDQSRDTGMALVLLLLLIAAARKREAYLFAAMALHAVNMIAPKIYRPAAVVWFGLSDLMGEVMSKVLLSIVFFGVVTPIAWIRKMAGRDSLKLGGFKAGKDSAMVERNHLFVPRDLERPY